MGRPSAARRADSTRRGVGPPTPVTAPLTSTCSGPSTRQNTGITSSVVNGRRNLLEFVYCNVRVVGRHSRGEPFGRVSQTRIVERTADDSPQPSDGSVCIRADSSTVPFQAGGDLLLVPTEGQTDDGNTVSQRGRDGAMAAVGDDEVGRRHELVMWHGSDGPDVRSRR